MLDVVKEMNQFEEATKLVKSWYGRFFKAELETPSFATFAVRSHELAKVNAPKTKLVVEDVECAYAKPPDTIVLPASYLTQAFYELAAIPPEYVNWAAMACINGSQIHESYHFKLTPGPDWRTFTVDNKKAVEFLEKSPAIYSTILNIVEDLFIEAWGRVNSPNLAKFVTAKNQVLFNDVKVDEWFEELTTVDANQMTLMAAFGCMKREALQEDPRYDKWPKYKAAFLEAVNPMLSVSGRLDIANRIMSMLRSDPPDDGSGEGEGKGKRLKTAPEPGSTSIAPDGKTSPEAIMNGSQLGWSGDEKSTKQLKERLANAENIKLVMAQFAEAEADSKTTIKSKEDAIKSSLGKIPPVKAIDILVAHVNEDAGRKIVGDPQFRGFGRHLRYLREVKHVPGQPREVGTTLISNRLANIVIDGKVLAFPDAVKVKRGRPEVIILVDLSGSMSSGELFVRVLNGAYEMFKSLRDARINVAVYAHTSSEMTPIVYGIAAHGMPFLGSKSEVNHANALTRFTRALRVKKAENYDGLAIEYCNSQFTTNAGSKFLIVLSDGEPSAGSRYWGQTAIDHTIVMVQKVRRSGTHIVSASLVDGVMYSNNKIYGEAFNLPAYRNLLMPALRNLTQKLALTR